MVAVTERMPRLLLVDDESHLLTLLSSMLSAHPYELLLASSGVQALQLASTHRPDLILLDVRMPEMDGYSVCQQLKLDKLLAQIPVIFLSAATESEERVRGFEVGAVDYVVKPFFADELFARIGLHLETARRLNNRSAELLNSSETVRGKEEAMVRAAVELLEQNLSSPPSLVELAHQIGTNEQSLNKVFKEHVGMTVFSYLRERRLQLSCELLKETSLSLQLVAEQVGYSGSANFITAFKERFGVTPKQYRSQDIMS